MLTVVSGSVCCDSMSVVVSGSVCCDRMSVVVSGSVCCDSMSVVVSGSVCCDSMSNQFEDLRASARRVSGRTLDPVFEPWAKNGGGCAQRLVQT